MLIKTLSENVFFQQGPGKQLVQSAWHERGSKHGTARGRARREARRGRGTPDVLKRRRSSVGDTPQ